MILRYYSAVPLALVAFCLLPVRSVRLPGEFSSIAFAGQTVYLSPFFGRSILVADGLDSVFAGAELRPLVFTADEDYRIRQFRAAPRGFYINDGRRIDKYFFPAGVVETVFSGSDIGRFAVLAGEEIVYIDTRRQELVFLNAGYRVRNRLGHQNTVDLYAEGGVIYGLARSEVVRYDEYGNVLDRIQVPDKMERLFVDGGKIFLFSGSKNFVYRYDGRWEKILLELLIGDIAVYDTNVVVLDNAGTSLHIFNRSEF